jgi:hypothetical protein
MTLSLEHICSKFIAMIDNKLNNNANKFRLRMKNKSVRIHILQVQNNGKVVPRTFQPTGFLLRHTFNCCHHRRRMSCHFAPISQERNFTSVLFFLSCHKNYNVEIDLSCSCVSILWCETKHLTCNSGSCVCSPTRQYVSAGCWLLLLRCKVVQKKTMVLATLCIQVCIDKFLATVYKHLSHVSSTAQR